MERSQVAATPPDIQTAQDLLAKMRAGTKQHHEVRMRDLVIPVRILSIDEVNMIRRESVAEAQKTPNGDDIDKNVAIQKKTLMKASSINGKPFLGDKILSLMSVDEINYLYEEYIKAMDDVNPVVDRMTDEQLRFLIDAIKKNSVSARDLSLLQLRAVFSMFQDLIQRAATQDSPKGN